MNLPSLFHNQPKPFNVSSISYKKTIDDQLISKLTYFLQSSQKDLIKQGYSKIIVKVSSDINSLVAAKLLQQVLADKVAAIIFDFEPTQTHSLVEFCQKLNLNTYTLNRTTAYQTELAAYHLHKQSDIKNFYQRFINYHLLIQAEIMKAAVVDIIDKSDRLLGSRPEGFYGHIMPFYSLYKSEVLDLARFLNIADQFIASTSYQQIPYPDNLTLTWDKVDPVLFLLAGKQINPEEISQQYNIDLQWLRKLKSHMDKQLLKITTSQFII